VQRAWVRGFSTSSDFSRTHSRFVAAAASAGYITTIDMHGYSAQWNVTVRGLLYLEEQHNELE